MCWHLSPPSGQAPLPSSPTLAPPVPILLHKRPPKLPSAPSRLEARTLRLLVRVPTGESSVSQRMLPAQRPANFELRQKKLMSHINNVQHPTCAYRANGGRQPLVWTFLRGGLGSLKLDEEAVAATASVSMTCWTLGREDRPLSSPLLHTEGPLSPS
jgi:hypothetical protein